VRRPVQHQAIVTTLSSFSSSLLTNYPDLSNSLPGLGVQRPIVLEILQPHRFGHSNSFFISATSAARKRVPTCATTKSSANQWKICTELLAASVMRFRAGSLINPRAASVRVALVVQEHTPRAVASATGRGANDGEMYPWVVKFLAQDLVFNLIGERSAPAIGSVYQLKKRFRPNALAVYPAVPHYRSWHYRRDPEGFSSASFMPATCACAKVAR